MASTLSTTKPNSRSSEGLRGSRPAAALYLVLEGERPLSGGARLSLAGVSEVRLGRGSARTWTVKNGVAALEIPDARMSRSHARLVCDEDGWTLDDEGSTNGTFLGPTRVTSAAIEGTTLMIVGASALLFVPEEESPLGTPALIDASSLAGRPRGMTTLIPSVESMFPQLTRVAQSELAVLLFGDSGAGKEVMARAIHDVSGRTGAFVALNCGALAPNLVESQLFGYVRGAFSGANRDEPGLVRSSSGGTLFLDEIGELPAAAQATLLRVLQEREVLPVGATRPIPVDLRVVTATLKPIAQSETFRADLYARIAAFVVRLPALRDRRADLGLLVADLLPRVAPHRATTIKLAPDLVTALALHSWPMNVRELGHVLSVASITATDQVLRLADVGEGLAPLPNSERAPLESRPEGTRSAPRPLTEDEVRVRDELVQALRRSGGNVGEVSRILGKTRTQIYRWLRRFALDLDSFRGPSP